MVPSSGFRWRRQIGSVAAAVLNKQCQTADKGCTSALGLCEGLTVSLHKKSACEVCFIEPQNSLDSLKKLRKWEMDMCLYFPFPQKNCFINTA